MVYTLPECYMSTGFWNTNSCDTMQRIKSANLLTVLVQSVKFWQLASQCAPQNVYMVNIDDECKM